MDMNNDEKNFAKRMVTQISTSGIAYNLAKEEAEKRKKRGFSSNISQIFTEAVLEKYGK